MYREFVGMPFDFDRDFVRPTAAVIDEIRGNVKADDQDRVPPEPPEPIKGKTAWERVLEDHPVFDRPWWKPSVPRVPTLKEVFPTFSSWGEKIRNRVNAWREGR